ncbi:MAG: quinolinate synthase NadA [Pseudomonadota bacterium]|nr:quinolinate synthase NadA [Pseudomonadota bacterium]
MQPFDLRTQEGIMLPAVRIDYEEEIHRLRREMNAVILAHYYQEDEIQDLADYVGDSLDLARRAARTEADVIVFCGVRFMAEGAKILNPEKLVLVPDMKAGCSLEESCPPEAFRQFKEQYSDHMVVTYINCSAEIKAMSDIIVTSSNAESIIRQIPADRKIIFAPDKYLGAYLVKKTGRDMVLWNGSCIVHERFSEQELVRLKTRHPQACIIAHPECPEQLLRHAVHIGSTSSLIRFSEQHAGGEFIVLTEPGILHEMKKRSPGSIFHDVPGVSGGTCVSCNSCPYMKLNSLEKIYHCMINRAPAITLSDELMKRARLPLEKMLEMSAAKPV